MSDADLLDALDRRARAAATAMEDAVASIVLPPFDHSADPDRAPRRRLSLAVAAAIVVVALAAAGIAILNGGEDPSTVATSSGPTHLVLPDPEPSGWELFAAFDAETGAGDVDVSMLRLPATVQGPQDADDPWDAAVVEYAMPTDGTTLGGEPVDIGGPEAIVETGGATPTVSWIDGDVVRVLTSAKLSTEELADIARAVVSTDTPPGAPLPGQDVLFSGTVQDVFPMLNAMLAAPGSEGVFYGSDDGDEPGSFILVVSSANETAWRASFALAQYVEPTTIRGRDAVIAQFTPASHEITWLEADGTLVRVEPRGIDPAALVPVLDQLVAVSDEEFDQLVADHPVENFSGPSSDSGSESESGSDSGSPETFEGQGSEIPLGQQLASVGIEADGWSVQVSLTDEADGPMIHSEAEWPSGRSTSSTQLRGLDVNEALVDHEGSLDGRVAIAGLIGPSVTGVEVRDAQTGEVATGSGPSTANLDGRDHVLFLAVLDPEWANRDLVVVGTAATGEEVQVRLLR